QLVLVVALVTALRVFWPRARAIPPEPYNDVPVWLAVPVVGALAAAAFVLAIESLEIDVFHHGEVLASALDLLQGGQPFKTFIWPHGLHDTGLAALWILVTGKIGTSPVALARATCRALGIVSTYCLARRLLGSRAEALVACAALALAPGLLADDVRREAEAVAGVSFVAGWPGREWFAYTLGELPRYHRDAVGIPFPWPVRGWPILSAAPPQVSLAWLVFVLLLLVQAVRTTILRRDPEPAVR